MIRSLDLKTGVERWASPPTGQNVVVRDKANPDSPGAEESEKMHEDWLPAVPDNVKSLFPEAFR